MDKTYTSKARIREFMLLNPEKLFSEASQTPNILNKENQPRIKILKSVIAGSENQGIIQIENPY